MLCITILLAKTKCSCNNGSGSNIKFTPSMKIVQKLRQNY